MKKTYKINLPKGMILKSDTKQIENVRWRAKKGEVYFHLVVGKAVIEQTDMRMATTSRPVKPQKKWRNR